jgi:hypothetical protein
LFESRFIVEVKLDLSKGNDLSHEGDVKTNFTSTINRLSNNNPIQHSSGSPFAEGTPLSSIITPASSSVMTVVPYSQPSHVGITPIPITIPITSNSHDNLASSQSSISQHINLKGRSAEGKIYCDKLLSYYSYCFLFLCFLI